MDENETSPSRLKSQQFTHETLKQLILDLYSNPNSVQDPKSDVKLNQTVGQYDSNQRGKNAALFDILLSLFSESTISFALSLVDEKCLVTCQCVPSNRCLTVALSHRSQSSGFQVLLDEKTCTCLYFVSDLTNPKCSFPFCGHLIANLIASCFQSHLHCTLKDGDVPLLFEAIGAKSTPKIFFQE